MELRRLKAILMCTGKEMVHKDLEVEDDFVFAFSFFPIKIKSQLEFPVFHLQHRFTDTENKEHFELVNLFEGFVMEVNKTLCTFAFPETITLMNVAAALSDGTDPQMCFFVIGDHVFLDTRNQDLVRNIVSVIDMEKHRIRETKTRLQDTNLNKSFYFFDGTRRLKIKITKRSVVYDFRAKLFVNRVTAKKILCKVCDAVAAEIDMLDDPILPRGNTSICKVCFNDLFMCPDGSLRYPEVLYRKL